MYLHRCAWLLLFIRKTNMYFGKFPLEVSVMLYSNRCNQRAYIAGLSNNACPKGIKSTEMERFYLQCSQNCPLYPKSQSQTKESMRSRHWPWMQGELKHSLMSKTNSLFFHPIVLIVRVHFKKSYAITTCKSNFVGNEEIQYNIS